MWEFKRGAVWLKPGQRLKVAQVSVTPGNRGSTAYASSAVYKQQAKRENRFQLSTPKYPERGENKKYFCCLHKYCF